METHRKLTLGCCCCRRGGSVGLHSGRTKGQTASFVNFFTQTQSLERLQRRLRHVRRVFGTERFGQNVFYADRFNDVPNGFARDDARSRRGRTQQYARAAEFGKNFVRDRGVHERNRDHALLGIFAALPDRVSDFAGFAEADADFALFVADDNKRAEAETTTALDDFGGAIDENHFLGQVAILVAKIIALPARTASRTAPAEAAEAAATITAATITAIARCGCAATAAASTLRGRCWRAAGWRGFGRCAR